MTNRTTAIAPACALLLLCGQGGCVNGDNPPVLVTFDAPHRGLEMRYYRYCSLAPQTDVIRDSDGVLEISNNTNAEANLTSYGTLLRVEDDGLSVQFTVPHDCYDGFLVDEMQARAALSFVSLGGRRGLFPSSVHISEEEWE